jgi:Asp-tRNA(Asn)/Glu-tRNA(Gln) amidotransferase B subunit
MEYEAVIGLEVHVQIKTVSKLFARSGYALYQKQERFFTTYDLPYTITSVFYPNGGTLRLF